MRSRGFGRVGVCSEERKEQPAGFPTAAGRCIRCRLHTESAVQITDLSRSRDNSYETQGFIPGPAIRGMAASVLASGDPEWFAATEQPPAKSRWVRKQLKVAVRLKPVFCD